MAKKKAEEATEITNGQNPASAEPEIEYITSTQLAESCGTDPVTLRRWLRTLPQYQDGNYTRYKWDPTDDFLTTAPEAFAQHQAQASQLNTEREAEKATKAAAKEARKAERQAAKANKASSTAVAVVEEEEGEEPDEDEPEELE